MKKWVLLALLVGILSCGKKSESDPQPDVPTTNNDTTSKPVEIKTGTILLHLHSYVDESEVDGYNITYSNLEGRQMRFSVAQLYLSQFELVRQDGSVYSVRDTVMLKKLEGYTYSLGKIPVGTYKSIRFSVGIPESLMGSVSTHPTFTDTLMWFNPKKQTDGYVFLHVKGKVDTTASATADESELQPFQYKIGTSANRKKVSLPEITITLAEGKSQFIHMIIDYNKLFNGIPLHQKDQLFVLDAASNSTTLATKLSNNIPFMFRYE
jgi:diacylglycerol kinase family enzyme